MPKDLLCRGVPGTHANAAALAAAAAMALVFSSMAATAEPLQMAGPAYCRYAPPAGFPSVGLTWSGACGQRLAQGSGTLRAYGSSTASGVHVSSVVRSYYGVMKNGQPALGVVDVPGEGYIAGRYAAGRPVADGDRNTLIQAFAAAAQAARELAAHYRQADRPASAQYYEAKAAELALQLD